MRKLATIALIASAAGVAGAVRVDAQTTSAPPTRTTSYSVARIEANKAPSSLLLFDSMDAVMMRLAGVVETNDSAAALVDNIRKKTNWLRGRWQNARSDPLGFRQTFAYDVAIALAAAADDDPARVVNVLRALNDDIVEKADHCAMSPSGMATPVRVSIRTLADGKVSPNWEILYMPKIMEFSSDPAGAAMPFRVFSSPAVDELAPGRYVVWARRPGANGVESVRTTIRVGGGATTLQQDIAVPK